ncbi:MAG: NAD(P)-dependent oxidoreductase [Lautropia sp.]|nr:NAD(P)-dependent oxidoreductase [Lautropia sp.]
MNTRASSSTTSITDPCQVAFLGLGVMGAPMAGHLAQAGHSVCVYNRTTARAERWLADHDTGHAAGPAATAQPRRHRMAMTPREAAQHADIVFSCVGNDDDLRSVTLGPDGAFAGMKPGALYVDHTTASAEISRELDAVARRLGLHFVDAPVSGGQAGAEKGCLTIMCGGTLADVERMRPVSMAYAQAITRIGDAGAGQLAKMVNQICIAGLIQGLAEAIHFGEAAGLDMNQVLGVIDKGAAQSWQMVNRGQTMTARQFDFGFAVDWMRKDLGLCLDQARRSGVTLPVTALVDQFYGDVQALGGNRWDTSSLIVRFDRRRKS